MWWTDKVHEHPRFLEHHWRTPSWSYPLRLENRQRIESEVIPAATVVWCAGMKANPLTRLSGTASAATLKEQACHSRCSSSGCTDSAGTSSLAYSDWDTQPAMWSERLLQASCILTSLPKLRVRKWPDDASLKAYYGRMNSNSSYPFRVSGIPVHVIDEFRQLSDDELEKHRIVRRVADKKPGFPCRISLVDAEIGESMLLLNFEHLPGLSPYRSVGPIFVRESANETYSKTNEIPEVLRVPGRLLSVRAYDVKDILVGAGCYSCRIDRA